jgi:NADH-quinone oxidoreductase subunit J
MLGIEIYTDYLYPLQVAAVILLVAIIAAIALTLRKRKDSRAMDPSEQVKARKADRVRLVRMPAEGGREGGAGSAAKGGEA